MKYDLTLFVIGVIVIIASFFTSYLCMANCTPCSGWDFFNPICQAGWAACIAGNVGCLGAATVFGTFLFWGGMLLLALWLFKDVIFAKKGRQ